MTTKVNYSVRNRNGQTVWLPPDPPSDMVNIAIPTIFEEDAVQKYPLGTRYVDGERVFHYYKCGSVAITYVLSAIFSTVEMFETAVNTYGAALAGATTIKVDGASAGSPVKDAWKDGYILAIGAAAGERFLMRIVSNLAAEADSPYAVQLTLEQPLPFDLSNDVNCEIFPSRYGAARSAHSQDLNGTYLTCLGMPTRKMTINYYGWVQTWGPAFCVRSAENLDTPGDRQVCVASDGSLRAVDYIINGNESYQEIGYSLAILTPSATGMGWFYLTIDP